ncbi:MAG: N-acetyl-gamma-glutamyl-phosphate reductase [Candidatus Hadarchaeum sp.]|uniref:N-acetyl-gamma-glutamyl-phosphate reductase n=1 Tax=Candidatus Hadarchaeum sp. TaxID=2883567 RepID=UPI003D1071B5
MTAGVAIVGASGYTGAELFRLLANHPKIKIVGAYGMKNTGRDVSEIHPHLHGIVDLKIEEIDCEKICKTADLVFTATPHGVAMKLVPELLKGNSKVIDLSADYRFDEVKTFERYYTKHESPHLKGVYGLPELYREKIKISNLVANPGCFPTAVILSLAPLVKEGLIDLDHIILDAKTGTSGAGATLTESTHHPVAGANVAAYAATTHRHTPEINQELSKLAGREVRVHFTPHLLPLIRGILSTAHVFLKKSMEKTELLKIYREFYGGEPFVRVRKELPQINYVVGSNYCDIGLEPEAEGGRVVVVAVIDNLVKGASGQAVQNMNLMLGFDETEGLRGPALRP